MNIVATIEARMGSTRLPGKVLLPAAGKPMLGHLIDRLRRVPSLDAIVLATTTHPGDDALEAFAQASGLLCFRGSEEDVMNRVIGAAALGKADIVVEITGDCPLIDPDLVEQTIRMFLANPCDYASNAHVRSYPDGMDVQVFPLEVLRRAYDQTKDKLDLEHVTLYVRNRPELFRHVHLVAPPSLHRPELGLTLDEPGDYTLLLRILEHFAPHTDCFSCQDVLNLLDAHPDWLLLNQDVHRKGNA